MCLSATGSPPRRTCARRSLALARAVPMSSNAVEPSVTRRLLPPRSYCTTQLREPPSRRRSPKPPSSSSQKVLSFVPGGRASVLMAVVVSFTGKPPAWAGHGQARPAFPCHLFAIAAFEIWQAGRVVCKLLHSPACSCITPTRTVLNRDVGFGARDCRKRQLFTEGGL